MAYIRPDQLSAGQKRIILQFLNSASSIEEIAEGVELPGEPDIGLALARRILEKREEQGGRFTSLEQILEIPYIGPERFTDLVRALVPEAGGEGASVSDLEALSARVQALSDEIERIFSLSGRGMRLTVFPDRKRVYVGEPVLIKARLADNQGSPMPGHPVTFFAQWGRFRQMSGLDQRDRGSITLVTGSDGIARALLVPSVSEPITADQEGALISALDMLPDDAPSPEAAREPLELMARAYASSAGRMLRQAVDIMLRTFHPEPWNSVNPPAFPNQWAEEEVAVMVMLQGGRPHKTVGPLIGDSSVQLSAVCTLNIIDWMPAWLELFSHIQEKEWGLAERLGGVKELVDGSYSPSAIINYHLHEMISFQRGIAGEYAGKRCIENAVTSFIQNDLDAMPEESRFNIYSGLSAASQSVATTGLKGWQSLIQQQQSLELELGARIEEKAGAAALEQLRHEVQSELENMISEVQESVQGMVEERLGGLSAEIGSISEKIEQMVSKQELDQVASKVEELSASIDQRLQDVVTKDQLDATEARLNEAISTRATVSEVRGLGQRIESIGAETATIHTEVSRIDSDVQNLKTRRTGLPS